MRIRLIASDMIEDPDQPDNQIDPVTGRSVKKMPMPRVMIENPGLVIREVDIARDGSALVAIDIDDTKRDIQTRIDDGERNGKWQTITPSGETMDETTVEPKEILEM